MALLSGVEAQVSLTMAFSSSAFFCLLFLIFLLTMGFTKFQGFHYHDVKWAFLEVLGKRPLSKKIKNKRSPMMRRMQFVFARAFPIPGSAQMDNEGEKHTYDG